MPRSAAIACMLTLAGLLGSAGICQAQNRIPDPPRQIAPPEPPKKPAPRTLPVQAITPEAAQAAQKAAVETVGQASDWPVATRRFWEERAQETLNINGVMWSTRVIQAGEQQEQVAERWRKAGSRTSPGKPTPGDLAQAYQADDAPRYIRLGDGATAQTIEQAAGMADGVETITGTPGSIKGRWANFRANKRNYLLAQVPDDVRGAFLDHKGEFTLVVKPDKEVEQTSAAGQKSLVRSYLIQPIASRPPTVEELRAWCRQNNVTAFPDPKPVAEAVDTSTHQRVIGKRRGEINDLVVNVRTYTFTWSNQTVIVNTAAR